MQHLKPHSHHRQAPPQARRPITVAVAGILAMHALSATAQQAPAAEAQTLETVVVTGIRKSLETTLNLKRRATGLVDGIVAEDIGKFPDTNLAESMQRISGVSIDRNASGEGSKITVRGLGPDYNMVLFNGRQMPAAIINNENNGASGSRAFDFANLSADAISALEVYKTSRSSTPTGGIGATINIKTGRPLDSRETVASIGIKANHDTSNSDLPASFKGSSITPELSGLYSTTFADNTIGIAISGSYSKRNSGSNKGYTQNGWRSFNANSGDWGSIPAKPAAGPDPVVNRPTGIYSTSVDMRYSLTGLQRERINGQAVLQFAPVKGLKFTLDHMSAANTIDKKNAELSSWFNFSFGPQGPNAPATTFTGGPVASPLVQTALFPNNDHDLAINGGIYGEKAKVSSTGFNTEWKVSEDLRIEIDAHHSKGGVKPNSPFGTYSLIDLALFNQGNATAHYDRDFPILSLPTTTMDPRKLKLSGSQFVSNLSDQTIDQFQTHANYKLGADDRLLIGLGFSKLKDRRASSNNQNNDWGGVGNDGDFASVKLHTENLGGFFGAIPGHNDPRLFPNFYLHDFNSMRSRSIEVVMAQRGLTRAQAEAYFLASPDYTGGNDWRTQEKSSNAFVQWDHAFDSSNLSLGLRHESTKIESASQVITYTGAKWISQNEIPLDRGAVAFGTGKGKYSYLLPSVDWDMDLTTDFKLRASYGENLARPDLSNMLGGVTLNTVANAGGNTGSTGNANLKPLRAKSLDFSAEWYYARSSYAAASLFLKKLNNFINADSVATTIPGIHTPIGGAYYRAGLAACGNNTQPLCIRNYIFRNFNGQPGVTATGDLNANEVQGTISGLPSDPLMPMRVSTPFNSTKGDKVKGLELNFQHMFGSSGFGISGNYSIVRTGAKIDNASLASQRAILGVSDSANLVGFFEDETWSVRAAYNWRDEFLTATSDQGGGNPVYTEAYGQVDVSIGYKLGKNLTLQADLINLNDGYIRLHGRTKEALVSATQTGRRFLVGARYKF